jgi:hypothetical protein
MHISALHFIALFPSGLTSSGHLTREVNRPLRPITPSVPAYRCEPILRAYRKKEYGSKKLPFDA